MKILVLICAALGFDTFKRNAKARFWKNLSCSGIDTVFPALTCPFQAALRTASDSDKHKISANGFFDREIHKTFFWEQSSELLKGKRIWDAHRKKGGKIAQLCLQQSLGTDSDIIISPAPIHKHHGGMIQDCYSKPSELYSNICSVAGRKFNLFNYWGPFTSQKSSRWICAAIEYTMMENLSDLLFAYLPHLDYDLQRYGTGTAAENKAFSILENILEELYGAAKNYGYEILILGDYQIENVHGFIQPNKILAEKGFFRTRNVRGMLYQDLFSSRAFALCDHQIADIYIIDQNIKDEVHDLFKKTEGIEKITANRPDRRTADFTLSASQGRWFSYKWWNEKKEAPDYALHVDIHNKPGFDPCELFISLFPPMSVPLDDHKVKGSHGSIDRKNNLILCASTFLENQNNLIELSKNLQKYL